MNPFDAPDYTGIPAIKYLRVSDKSQTTRGDGLNSQDVKCSEYANYLQSKVVRTFIDDVTGSKQEREGMDDVIQFLRENKKTGPYLVLIDDVSRLARDIRVYWNLRDAIAEAGGILVSPNMTFRDDADGRHYQNMQASNAEWQRLKNKEQTNNRMRGRLMNGHWPFSKPVGYKHIKIKGIGGHCLVRDEPLASIVEEALLGFASRRFETQAEVMRFLQSFPEYPKDKSNTVRNQRVKDILTRPIYAGYVGHEPWGIALRKGWHHDDHRLIDLEDFEKIQKRLKDEARAPARADIRNDFPLRNFVLCGDCNKPLTSCYSKSKTGKQHPYYLCYNKDCESYRKSIRRDDIEGAFEVLLANIQPSQKLAAMGKAMLKQAWDFRIKAAASVQESAKKKMLEIDKQVEALLDKIVDASTPRVISAFEQRIDKLEREKLVLAEKASQTHKPLYRFEEMFELAMQFLTSPYKIWEKGDLTHKRTVLKLAFEERLAYQRNEGFRTPKTTIPFKVLGDFCSGNFEMAHPKRFEPLASAFGGLIKNRS